MLLKDEVYWQRKIQMAKASAIGRPLATQAMIAKGKATRKKIYDQYIALGGNAEAIKTLAFRRKCTRRTIYDHLAKYKKDMEVT